MGAPEVTDLDPEANASSAMQGAAVSATFDQNMDPATATTFVVYGDQTGKLAGVYVGGGTDTLGFNPNLGFNAAHFAPQHFVDQPGPLILPVDAIHRDQDVDVLSIQLPAALRG